MCVRVLGTLPILCIVLLIGCSPPTTVHPTTLEAEEPSASTTDAVYAPCAKKQCGERCVQCAPTDSDCFETAVPKLCDTHGSCLPESAELIQSCAKDEP